VSFLLALVGTLLVAVIYTGAGGRRGDLAAMVERMMVGALGLAVVGAVCGLLGGLRAAKTAAFLSGLAGTAVTLFAFPDWVRDSVGDRTYLPLGTFSVAFLLGAAVGADPDSGRPAPRMRPGAIPP
jgi:hypothetical protein